MSPTECPDLVPYILEKRFDVVKSFKWCKFVDLALYHCCPMFRPKKIEAEEKINALRTFQEQTTEKVRNYLSILNNYRYVT